MTRVLEAKDGLSQPDEKVLTDIENHGWHVVQVFSNNNESRPEWAFSIGLFHTFKHPEVIIFGLPLDRCHAIINEIGAGVKGGKEYSAGPEYGDILVEPYRCVFRPVRQKHYRDYVGYARWFYEADPFPVLQCFWPDKVQKYPWDSDCNSYVRNSQPLLFLPDEVIL